MPVLRSVAASGSRIAILASLLACLAAASLPAQDTTMARSFVEAVNAMRANPASFLPTVDAYVREWRSFVPNKKALESAAAELKKELRKHAPLAPFQIDTDLVHASADHARDSRQMGVLGHIGSDGSNPADRVARYAVMTQVNEVITYGQSTAAYMLAAFLIDEQDPKRGHRKALLSKTLTLIGVTVDSHPAYRTQCVAVLGTR